MALCGMFFRAAEDYFGDAAGILFVVDSTSLTSKRRAVSEVRDVSEYMAKLLTNRTIDANKPPILVVCNKVRCTHCAPSRIKAHTAHDQAVCTTHILAVFSPVGRGGGSGAMDSA